MGTPIVREETAGAGGWGYGVVSEYSLLVVLQTGLP
jgi:hypothetical protein